MKAIVATDINWGIGKNNKLLFHIPEDMKFFKRKTIGNIVIMGHNTLKSLPDSKPLPARVNLVLSNTTHIDSPSLLIGSKNELDKRVDYLLTHDFTTDNIYIIGGESVYKLYIADCNIVYRTVLDKAFDFDKQFPILSDIGFECSNILFRGIYKDSKWWIEEWTNKNL